MSTNCFLKNSFFFSFLFSAKSEGICKTNNHICNLLSHLFLVSSPEISMSMVRWSEKSLNLRIKKNFSDEESKLLHPRADITNYHMLGGLKQQKTRLSHFWRSKVPHQVICKAKLPLKCLGEKSLVSSSFP